MWHSRPVLELLSGSGAASRRNTETIALQKLPSPPPEDQKAQKVSAGSGDGEVKRGDKNRVGEESGEEAKMFLGLKQL